MKNLTRVIFVFLFLTFVSFNYAGNNNSNTATNSVSPGFTVPTQPTDGVGENDGKIPDDSSSHWGRHSTNAGRVLQQYLMQAKQTNVNRTLTSERLTHTIEGEWDYVFSHIGYTFEHPTNGEQLQSLISYRAQPDENGNYSVPEWDLNVFWMHFGDGTPVAITAIHYGYYTASEEDTVLPTSGYYWELPYVYIILPGVDYSEYIYQAAPGSLCLVTDEDNNVLDYCIDIYNDDGEYQYSTKLQEGDKILNLSPGLILNNPGWVNVNSFDLIYDENGFPSTDSGRVVSQPLTFSYEHLTPGIDFEIPEPFASGDYSSVDLKVVLEGYRKTSEGWEFKYSDVKNLDMKWDISQSAVQFSDQYK